jgi:hypothetical protein
VNHLTDEQHSSIVIQTGTITDNRKESRNMAVMHMSWSNDGSGRETRCGKWDISIPKSEDWAQVTCKVCLKAYVWPTSARRANGTWGRNGFTSRVVMGVPPPIQAEEWQAIRAGQDPVSVCGTAGGHHDYVAIFPYTDKLRQYWRCSRCRKVAT